MVFIQHTYMIVNPLNNKQDTEFGFDSPHHITVTIRPQSDNSDRTALCIVMGEYKLSPNVQSAFDALADNHLPQGSKDPNDWNRSFPFKTEENTLTNPDGSIRNTVILPLGIMPEPFQSFSRQVSDELNDYTRRTIRAIRWRYGIGGHHNPIKSFQESLWSFDKKTWKQMPSALTGIGWGEVVAKPLTQKGKDEILQLVNGNIVEPLGHELYREAAELRATNPRSALVMAIAAAEIGFKQCVVFLVPDTKWLIENLPTPPLTTMLQEYLPKLPVKNKMLGQISIPTHIMDTLKKGVPLRNSIVHGKPATLRPDDLKEILLAVRDLLYLFDYYCGFKWALDRLSNETNKALRMQSE